MMNEQHAGVQPHGVVFTAVLAVCHLLTLPPSMLLAQMRPDGILFGEAKRDTLRDLMGIEVVVESFHHNGLSSRDLQAAVESQLEAAGIRILTAEERLNQPGNPYLYVRLSMLQADSVYSYTLEISVNQTVSLTRHPTITTFAPTWSVQAVGAMSPLNSTIIRDTVKDYAQRFVDAYHAANQAESAALR
jgi:hypothetical protein